MSADRRQELPGRRISDDCAQCLVVGERIANHGKEIAENKTEIETVHRRIDGSLPRWVFILVFGAATSAWLSIAGFQTVKMIEIGNSIAVLQTEMTAVKRAVDNRQGGG